MSDSDRVVIDTQLVLAGHLTCPSCSQARPGRCCACGTELLPEEEVLKPDPYGYNVAGSTSPHVQCKMCLRESVLNVEEF